MYYFYKNFFMRVLIGILIMIITLAAESKSINPQDSSENVKAKTMFAATTQQLYIIPLGYSPSSDALFGLSFQDGIVNKYFAAQVPFNIIVAPIVEGELSKRYLSKPDEYSKLKNIDAKFIISIIKDNNADLYIAKFSNGTFTYEKLPFNSEYNEVMGTFDAEGNKIFFASDRPGGFGGYDIYESEWDGKKWTEPKNLGPHVNTTGDEIAPFMLKDGVTLYFSSRRDGKQDFDIYVTTFSDELVDWGEAEKLKYPINTDADDIFFRVSPDETRAVYCSSGKEGYGVYEVLFK
jgi:hypothetical protein